MIFISLSVDFDTPALIVFNFKLFLKGFLKGYGKRVPVDFLSVLKIKNDISAKVFYGTRKIIGDCR
jgi:hypothetical protein